MVTKLLNRLEQWQNKIDNLPKPPKPKIMQVNHFCDGQLKETWLLRPGTYWDFEIKKG